MGTEIQEKISNNILTKEKQLTLLTDNDSIIKIPFSEIKSLDIINESIKKDLKFYLDTVIAGKKKDLKKITLNCESGGNDDVERKIIASYLHESPIWKINYRIIMSKEQEKENKCLITGFSLIENVTNQDWENVNIILVAGMTVSFVYNAYPAIYITARPTEIEEGLEREEYAEYPKTEAKKKKAKEKAYRAVSRAPAKPMAQPATTGMFSSLMEDVSGDFGGYKDAMNKQASVQTKDLGELFEYNIANPVSIKRKHSALVPILTEEIKAKKILLYNINEMDKNPNACLEVTNNSSLTLERGPVTIIYDNNLAGEAIIPFLNKDDTRLLNYAVEQAVLINHESKTENKNIHRISISGAYSYEYYFTNLYSTYKIKNKTNEEKTLYLDHPKKSGYKITDSPVDPEETANYWRFKLTLKPKDAIVFKISERYENYTSYYIYNYSKKDLLKRIAFYVQKKFIDLELEGKLLEIGKMLGKRNKMEDTRNRLQNAKYQMNDEQSRLRENIRVLGNTTQENALREKYVKKFSEQEANYENISDELKRIENDLAELNKEIDEKIENLKYEKEEDD
ncbi:MAG: hypothetical protein ACTSR8_08995 [Promethearchaeota archaeon]